MKSVIIPVKKLKFKNLIFNRSDLFAPQVTRLDVLEFEVIPARENWVRVREFPATLIFPLNFNFIPVIPNSSKNNE